MARKHADLGVSIEWTKDSEQKLHRIASMDAALFRRARGRAANTLKRALFATIRKRGNAKYGVPRLARRDAVTVAANGGRPRDVFGKFATDPVYTVAYLRGDVQVVGWADRLHGFMSALQDSEQRDLSPFERASLGIRMRGSGVRLPVSYKRPERNVIEPFAACMTEKFPDWIIGAFKSEAKRRGIEVNV